MNAISVGRGRARRAAGLLVVLSAVLCGACATPYAYRFDAGAAGQTFAPGPGAPGDASSLEDADLKAELHVDTTAPQAIVLALTNKTDDVIQVRWAELVLLDSRGGHSAPRPDADLGWIAAGASQTARLIPFALPDRGDAALAYQDALFELQVPITVRHERKLYRYALRAHVAKVQK